MCQTTAGNNAMHMHMIPDLLVPGVQYLDDTRYCTEILLIQGKFEKCFCAAFVEEAVEKLLVTANKWI